jgi:GT2 family glycosyltransferase
MIKPFMKSNNVIKCGAIAIGRNEGGRLKKCLESLHATAVIVYVDSGSTDGSAEWARKRNAEVIELDIAAPFTAARARNAGLRRMREIAPDLRYVQFIDGDCELIEGWADSALSFLESHDNVAAVCGRRRERHPQRSVYNWLCDQEWNGPVGEVRACGGDVMMRITAFNSVGGFREELIAGEEPELCVRLRALGWQVWRLDAGMTWHDADMLHLGQWWRRCVRSGYAFAQGAYLHGGKPERHWVWESRRAWFWGVCLPLTCMVGGLIFSRWAWALLLIYPTHVLQKIVRDRGPLPQRVVLALFFVLGHFAEGIGQIKFVRDRLRGRQTRLIEYK